jgi:peptidoglycan L-alanyl-D-glutamate endopeptidase CwlK
VWVVVKRSAIVTKARPGSSAHNFGYGFDICFRGADPYLHAYEVENGGASDPRWEQAGELMESVGLAWGGRWKSIKDRPHAEEPSWKVLSGSFT